MHVNVRNPSLGSMTVIAGVIAREAGLDSTTLTLYGLQRKRCTARKVPHREVRIVQEKDNTMAISAGCRFPVSMAQVFPDGCYLVPGSISEAQDYDEKTKTRSPAKDKVTGSRVFQCRVVDMDPELEGRSRETVVKILTDYQPVPPGRAPFELVEFEHLTVTPYVNDKNRMAYSLRATGLKAAARPAPAPAPSKDAA